MKSIKIFIMFYWYVHEVNLFLTDCAVVNKEGWLQLGPTISVNECKSSCLENDKKWQWVFFQDSACYCIQILDKGWCFRFIEN
jgi:hypothetical protein